MTMKRLGFAMALLFAGTASAREHVVAPRAADERLLVAAAGRQADLRALDAFLASPQAARATEHLGLDARRLRAGIAGLSDAELQDLAARAQALRADPTPGLSGDVNQLLIIFLIVAIVILVLRAVD
jgi:hypothetical protein